MDLHLEGKVALVSGSSRGIGKEVAEMLLRSGCRVYINGRDKARLQETAGVLADKGYSGAVSQLNCDLTVSENIRSAILQIGRDQGALDIVVANIGTGRSHMGWDVTDEEWQRMLEVNLLATVRLCRESIKIMKDRGSGSIVCVSSIAGCEAVPAPLPYSASKAALLSFVKNTSDVVAQYGIRLNAVSPGNVLAEGGTWERKMKEDREKVMSYINTAVPLKNFIAPSDVANLVLFLASDLARFVTGANFVVDGGQVRKFL